MDGCMHAWMEGRKDEYKKEETWREVAMHRSQITSQEQFLEHHICKST
jgi:hypothetical protein